MTLRPLLAAALIACAPLSAALAAEASATVTLKVATPQGDGGPVGTVTMTETKYGLVFTPKLSGLPPGLHGFHVHANPSCAAGEKDGKPVPADGAGGHFDPKKSGKHGEPWGDGHLGDLPPMYVNAEGEAVQPVLAPRLTLNDVKGHALMVHAGGDNHADHPAPLGGGGARIACGVIQ
ncbi:MAG: superoxide dismutase family protein [Mitsuaria chitosanitabida]|jgi:Cu-Zn family superoxide dismutase|uniref:superoxide dismutase [Cu-Zn] SodC n=1 Tax=Roseateles chitosanitabidus TaxID=65048 RepID=UPI001B2BA897|nr:superoxide dismutase [Cu-Zn] SodC [Roseateles chitosanitabidus]MBO9685138.1 superoxide dismutase family protein [Roseateles chitosanitabidus]